ncbi:hypothetical protein [Roseobacter litoralis]|uniref:hypothetical protein n=1 Tax=Roseobacter litoralis TaxID=42443 RepID=UPI002490BD66|nr:hypothetical protein [Roseobacter litoralis]
MEIEEKNTNAQALERYDSAMVDADIEGLARDPEAEAMIAQWRADGVSVEAQIELLKDLYQGRQLRAAE